MASRIDFSTKLLVGLVLLSDLLYTGLVFGWAPIVLWLQEENQYGELCPDGQGPCDEQENQLNLIFSIAAFAVNINALPVGIILDKFGPKFSVIIAASFEITGLLLLAFSESATFDAFIPGFVAIAVGGQITMLASYPVSFLVMESQTAILAGISCLFDGCCIIFVALYAVHNVFGFSRKEIFIAYSILGAVLYSALILLWGLKEQDLPMDDNSSDESGEETELITDGQSLMSPCDGNSVCTESPSKKDKTYGSITTTNEKYDIVEKSSSETDISVLPLKKQLRTYEFVFGMIFASIQVLRANIYIGTNNKLLQNYGDAQHGNLYTQIFGIVLPMGFLFVPLIDHLVERKGLSTSLYFTTNLGMAFNALAMVPVLPLQCVVFLTFTGFRAFVYAIISAFNAKIFGLKNLGTITGVIFTVGAVMNLLEYPAVTFTNKYLNGDLTVMYAVLLILCSALYPFIWYFKKRQTRREENSTKEFEIAGFPAKTLKKTNSMTYYRSPSRLSPTINRRDKSSKNQRDNDSINVASIA